MYVKDLFPEYIDTLTNSGINKLKWYLYLPVTVPAFFWAREKTRADFKDSIKPLVYSRKYKINVG